MNTRNMLSEHMEALVQMAIRVANMKTQTQEQRDLRCDVQTLLIAMEKDWRTEAKKAA